MAVIFHLTLILVLALVKGDNMLRDDDTSSKSKPENDAIAYESFGAPVYGSSNALPFPGMPLNGKSTYNSPAPPPSPMSYLPTNYVSYLTSLGLNNPASYGAYNRYSFMPYTIPPSYGSSLQNSLGYGSAFVPGFGYSGYGSPYFGRSTYSVDGYAFPGYAAGLGYRYSNLGFPSAAFRTSPVARSASPVPAVSAPASIFSAPAPAAAASISAFSPYRSSVRALQSKDGSVRYAYTPDGQVLPAY